ncbi:hypothetical protein [Stenotrophomonas sp. AR026]|uniref:hypothetical protein n=1 Tax=Stenotrophomonas sp. AR026 TaxID=3398462 RepID=UPI003BAF4A09
MANALTGNFGPLAALDYVQQQGEIGRQRGQQNRLNMLTGQAYSATTPQDQSSLLGQMAQISPQAAQAQQQQFQSQEDRNRTLVYNAARYLKGALDRQNPAEIAGAWRAVRPGLINAGLATEQELSPDWQPDYAQTVHQALAMGDGGTGQGVQSTYVDDQGQRVAILRDGSTRVLGGNDAGSNQQTLTIDVNGTPTQVTFDRRTGRYTNANLGAPQRPLQQIDGQPTYIDPTLPPQVQAAIRAGGGTNLQDGGQLQVAQGTPLVGRRKEDEAAAVEAAKTRVDNENFPNRLDQERQLRDVQTQGAITQAAGTAAAEAQAKDAAQRPKRIQQYRQALTAAGNVETSLDKALGLLSPYSTGFVGARSRGVEGSPSYNLASELETIKANLGFDRLQQMRDSSPTGGALGAIAVQELVALQSTIANLDPNQSESQIRANLERVKNHYTQWRSAVEQSLADEERAQNSAPPAAASRPAPASAPASTGYSNLWN